MRPERPVLGPNGLVLHPSRQKIRPKKGVMRLKIGPVCLLWPFQAMQVQHKGVEHAHQAPGRPLRTLELGFASREKDSIVPGM